MKKNYWVYMLHCDNDCYYTGYTTDLLKRYQAHLSGVASKYTRSFKPLRIAQFWKISDKTLAMQLENRIKKLSRQKKVIIVENPKLLYKFLLDR